MSQNVNVKELPEVLRSAVKQVSKKHSAYVSKRSSVELATGWDGGSRSQFYLLPLGTGRVEFLPGNSESAWMGSKRTTPTYSLSPGMAVIECGTFCGKPATPFVMLHEADYARFFPSEEVPDGN